MTRTSTASDAPRSAANSAAQGVLCAGLVLCAVAFLPRAGEVSADDFMFPRELLLNAAAGIAAVLCLLAARRLRVGVDDALLAAFVALGALSSLVAAQNTWVAARAFGLTAAGAAVFWCARALAREGRRRALLAAAAVAAAALAATALVEAYAGLKVSLPGRAPGGALGHRNSAAHAMVLALPLLVLLAARAERAWTRWAVAVAMAMAGAVVVLSRSRGAWLAAMVVGAVALGLHLARRKAGRQSVAPGVRVALAGLVVGGALAAILPNQLGWSTSQADTLRRLADYREGSGRGRLVQYARTWQMAADHSALGVGPGNWMVQYPLYAQPDDPSFHPRDLVPTNRLPQGDVMGMLAERGFPAFLLLLSFGATLAARAWRSVRGTGDEAESADESYALLCTLAALAVLGTFDPILLQPLHSFLVFLALGALAPLGPAWKEIDLRLPARSALAAALLVLLAAPLSVTSRQMLSARHLRAPGGVDGLAAAIRTSPGDYRLQAMMAVGLVKQGRCEQARVHIQAAIALFPTAPVPHALEHQCGAASALAPVGATPLP